MKLILLLNTMKEEMVDLTLGGHNIVTFTQTLENAFLRKKPEKPADLNIKLLPCVKVVLHVIVLSVCTLTQI